jgi:hypothetical protein
MRTISSLCLRHAVQVCDYNLGSSTWATYGFCVVPHGGLVNHVPVPKETISNLAPAILEIVVHHLASHPFGLIGDLAHHTARQCGYNGTR